MDIQKEGILKSETEEWRDVKDYEGLYQVSNFGRVRSLDREYVNSLGVKKYLKSRVFKLEYKNSDGYINSTLRKDGTSRTVRVHRLVAEAFLPNPENKPQVNHKNSVRHDNSVGNLEWCTVSENMKHRFLVGNMKGKGGKSNPRSLPVINCRGEIFDTMKEAAEKYRTKVCSIGRVCRGERSTSGKYANGTRIKWRVV